MKTVLLDVDGVLVDTPKFVHDFCERTLKRPLKPVDLWAHFDFAKSMGLAQHEYRICVETLRNDPTQIEQLEFYRGAFDFVEVLAAYFDVCFVTAPWIGLPTWTHTRETLLKKYWNLDVIHTAAKYRVKGDVLIDDCTENVEEYGTSGVLFSRSWNRSADASLTRVFDYQGAIELCRSL